MAYTKRMSVKEYPYCGTFSHIKEDMSLPLDQREQTEIDVYTTVCDIQEVSKAMNPALIATFSVFFPYDIHASDCPVQRGMQFRGDMCGIEVKGVVTNVVASQLDGIVAYVKDSVVD